MTIKIPYSTLANTDIKLSKLGLGTVKFGRNTQVKYPNKFAIPKTDSIINILELCQELGINTLDTAPAYGDAEQKLGKIFQTYSNSLSRSDWVIIGKGGENFINNTSCYDFSAKSIDNSLNQSLKKLNTDYLDIFLIHSNGDDQKIANNQELWQLLDYRKQQGDIRAYGVSSKTVEGGLACLKQADVAMLTYRSDYLDEKPLLDYALSHNKGILLKKVLNSGNISSQHTAKDYLQYSGSHPAVNSMIIGTINPAHIKMNIQAICES